MKKALIAAAFCLTFVAGIAFSYARDWHDMDEVHKHVMDAIHEMDRARAANHFDMAGHGARAVEHLRDADRELGLAIESARKE